VLNRLRHHPSPVGERFHPQITTKDICIHGVLLASLQHKRRVGNESKNNEFHLDVVLYVSCALHKFVHGCIFRILEPNVVVPIKVICAMSEVQSIHHYTRGYGYEPDGHKCDCIRVSLRYSIICLGPLTYHGRCSSFSGTTALFVI
jgi:hypothetical protein